jgi:rSAM/selenodomain-associated transferase 1
MTKELLIIFVKNPQLGKAKTRLARTIGDHKALSIYRLLLRRTKEVTYLLPYDIQIHYSDFIENDDLWTNDRFDKAIQIQGDLGAKMRHAFQGAFDQGYEKICIIGSDCYDLEKTYITEAFDLLHQNDFVIGPSQDGGYYLLGMKELLEPIFQDKQWSTSNVFSSSIADMKAFHKSYALLPKISDVDVEEDLGPWANEIINT